MPEQELPKTVLLVSDDGSGLKVISSVLKKAGFHVLAARCEAAAVKRSAPQQGAIDLAIIDAPMAQTSRPEVLQALHEKWPQIRMLFLSAGEQAHDEHGTAGHIRGYLPKPVRKAQLLGTVLKVLDT